MKVFTHNKPAALLEGFKQSVQQRQVIGGRVYETPNGKLYPSVTTVTGFKKKDFFARWRAENPEESRRVLSRGNSLHKITEKYLMNEGEPSPDDPIALSLFRKIQSEIDKIDNIHLLESPLYSDLLCMAGRVDCIGEYEGTLSVIDFKTSTRKKYASDIADYFMQVTAYAIMYMEHTKIPIKNVVIIMSCDDGTSETYQADPKDYVVSLRETIKDYQAQLVA